VSPAVLDAGEKSDALLQLAKRNGGSTARPDEGGHFNDGSICFTSSAAHTLVSLGPQRLNIRSFAFASIPSLSLPPPPALSQTLSA
jgi:hypothetical protein